MRSRALSRLSLLLDLGDVYTKALVTSSAREERLRFPSVVASRLLRDAAEMTRLSLDEAAAVPRFIQVDPSELSRTRSYARGAAFVRYAQKSPAAEGARFAGRIAASYGADRRTLGRSPDVEAVDALVHKAIILSGAEDDCEADVTLVVDSGPKADTITRYARASPRSWDVELRSHVRRTPRRLRVRLRARIVDAPACAAVALPDWLSPAELDAVLLVDIGYLRTKLSIVSTAGCGHQEVVDALGTSDIVQRVLRDGGGTGILEDEFAVLDALEQCRNETIEIAGRSFSVEEPLRGARRALEDELSFAARRALLAHHQRSGRTVHGVAVFGGGVHWLGEGLEARLRSAALGITSVWLSPEPSYLLVDGAREQARRCPAPDQNAE